MKGSVKGLRKAACRGGSYHHISLLGMLCLGLLGLGPEGQVIFSLVFLHVQVHGLFPLVVVHPYQSAFGIKDDRTTCRARDHRASRGEEEAAVVATGIPLCDLGSRRLEIDGMEVLARIDAVKAEVPGVERECGGPGNGKSRKEQETPHNEIKRNLELELEFGIETK